MKRFLISLVVFFAFFNVKAIDCSEDELFRLKELADNIIIRYTYHFSDENVLFNLQLYNYSNDLKINYKEFNYGQSINNISKSDLEMIKFNEGDRIELAIYPNYLGCGNRELRIIEYELPIYNRYYHIHQDKCLEHSDFIYCQEFLDVSNLTFDEIDYLFDEYLNKSEQSDDINKGIDFIYILIGTILILLILVVIFIVIMIKKRKKSVI